MAQPFALTPKVVLILIFLYMVLKKCHTKQGETYALPAGFVSNPALLEDNKTYLVYTLETTVSPTATPGQNTSVTCSPFAPTIYQYIEDKDCGVAECTLPAVSPTNCVKGTNNVYTTTCTSTIQSQPQGLGKACPTPTQLVRTQICPAVNAVCKTNNDLVLSNYIFATTPTFGMRINNTYINDKIPMRASPFIIRNVVKQTFIVLSGTALSFTTDKKLATPFMLAAARNADGTFNTTGAYYIVPLVNPKIMWQPTACFPPSGTNFVGLKVASRTYNNCNRTDGNFAYQFPAFYFSGVKTLTGKTSSNIDLTATGMLIKSWFNNSYNVHGESQDASQGKTVGLQNVESVFGLFDWQYV